MTGEEALAQVITEAKAAAGIGPGGILAYWCSSARAQIEVQGAELNRLRAALQEAWDFAAGGQIPKASTLKRWSDLLAR